MTLGDLKNQGSGLTFVYERIELGFDRVRKCIQIMNFEVISLAENARRFKPSVFPAFPEEENRRWVRQADGFVLSECDVVRDVVVAFGIVVAGVAKPRKHMVVPTVNRDLQMAKNDGIGFTRDVFVAAEPFEFPCEVDGKFSVSSDAAEARFARF